jgi:hypothetical protein
MRRYRSGIAARYLRGWRSMMVVRPVVWRYLAVSRQEIWTSSWAPDSQALSKRALRHLG